MTKFLAAIIFCLPILAASGSAAADDWADSIPVGAPFPAFTLEDQSGKAWNEQSMLGQNGTVFLFNRSTSW